MSMMPRSGRLRLNPGLAPAVVVADSADLESHREWVWLQATAIAARDPPGTSERRRLCSRARLSSPVCLGAGHIRRLSQLEPIRLAAKIPLGAGFRSGGHPFVAAAEGARGRGVFPPYCAARAAALLVRLEEVADDVGQ